MTLIKSISGIRGTIGGKAGENFTPVDIVRFTAAYGMWIRNNTKKKKMKVVVGRDARISGTIVSSLVNSTLLSLGIDVVDLGLSTTPTVEIAVTDENADGGIIVTASHNPKQWNALKLLNAKGEFVSDADGKEILHFTLDDSYYFSEVNALGTFKSDDSYFKKHIDKIIALPNVDVKTIRSKKFKVVIDCVNSTGGIVLPKLLTALGVNEIIELHCTPDGDFSHNPEPLPENLRDLSKAVIKNKAHLGIAVDPDVDRLALVCEDGEVFGEEYTLVAVADYVLSRRKPADKANKKSATVSNLSSTQALRDITRNHHGAYYASAVGEVNVVEMMKKTNAIIGGEGNGGVIIPELHYGRDALGAIALFLSHLACFGKTASMLRATYPDYFISKNKIELTPEMSVDKILEAIQNKYKEYNIITVDGVKIDFSTRNISVTSSSDKSASRSASGRNQQLNKEWVHLRKSNTESIIRIYAESNLQTTADNLAKKIMMDVRELMKEGRNR